MPEGGNKSRTQKGQYKHGYKKSYPQTQEIYKKY